MRTRLRITGRRSARGCGRRNSGLCVVLIALAFFAGCTGAGKTPRRGDIDPAIALFIAGHYAQAVERLGRLAATLESSEDLREVYYYLGRAYLALGERNRAIDAFSAGVSYGDTGACLEYLDRLRTVVQGEEHSVRRSEMVTRRQLAALLVREFAPGEADSTRVADADAPLRRSVALGWMPALPDGATHGEVAVTRAAFYVTMARLTGQLGYGRTVIAPYARSLTARGREPVNGREVTAVFDELSVLRKQHGG